MSFFGIAIFVSCQQEEKTDPCAMQYCLNGGDCLNGDCLCPPGFSGKHCEIKDQQPSSGFNCVNGNCIEVSENGTYTTKADCEAACGGGNPNPTPGYVCQTGNCKWVSDGGQYQSLSACQSQCGSTSNEGKVQFKNNAFTTVNITFDGISRTIQPGSTVTFTGTKNQTGTGTASTSGKTSTGTTVGKILGWNNLSATYGDPSSPPVVNLDISAQYFFLKIKNIGNYNLSGLTVNYGTVAQTFDNISIPNNGTTYSIGYYEAYSNTEIRSDLAGSGGFYSYWDNGVHFTFPNTINQSVTIQNTNLRESEILEQ